MTREDLTSPIAAAATSQVNHCPYHEEEPHIWFHLMKAHFAAAGIKWQKLKYANAFASLPKQVLRDILDTLDACNDSDEPFDFLKNTYLGQLGKSKWQSYFELLHLPMEMQGPKPSVLMGKLKQHLPLKVSHCKAGEANTSLKTASCKAGPGTTLTYSSEIYIWSLLIQEFDDECCFPNSICDLPKCHLYKGYTKLLNMFSQDLIPCP
jgi:hypothetical protein